MLRPPPLMYSWEYLLWVILQAFSIQTRKWAIRYAHNIAHKYWRFCRVSIHVPILMQVTTGQLLGNPMLGVKHGSSILTARGDSSHVEDSKSSALEASKASKASKAKKVKHPSELVERWGHESFFKQQLEQPQPRQGKKKGLGGARG